MPYDPGGTQTHQIRFEAMIVVAIDNHNMNTTPQCHTTRSNLVLLDHIRTQNQGSYRWLQRTTPKATMWYSDHITELTYYPRDFFAKEIKARYRLCRSTIGESQDRIVECSTMYTQERGRRSNRESVRRILGRTPEFWMVLRQALYPSPRPLCLKPGYQ